ncbi:MAG: FAD-dependent oxidoreductase [Acidimicrobiales bacterium]|nr:FAD-dependent oxidoreductase [Acidimicrobiales bacterium]
MASEPRAAAPSLWRDLAGPAPRRAALDGDADVDVAVVGAGYTGLWTAYYLLAADPTLRVLVIEREHVGFGASGRNGGWCVGELAAGFDHLAAAAGHDRAVATLRALHDTVDEVGRVIAAEGIEAGFAKGGTVRLARNGAQAARQRDEVDHHRHLGFGPEVVRLLDRDEAAAHLAATDVVGGLRFGPTAAVQPLELVRGLARAVEARGGRIVEQTAATAIGPRRVDTEAGTVRAPVVVRATEGYTASLAGHRRTLLPLYSLMIATEPLDDDRWASIGLRHRETFADDRHLVIYGQRTADGRIAFGGRGAPYHWGSGIRPATEHGSAAHDAVEATLRELLPQLEGVAVTHRWGGVLGVPRDWFPAVAFDRASGLATAGGYVGEGVAAANLAGRTLAELVTDRPGELAGLAWVGHRSRRWEPEPLRWLGINAGLALSAAADRAEARTGRAGWQSRLLARFVG